MYLGASPGRVKEIPGGGFRFGEVSEEWQVNDVQ
jgi:hypothetical protein